MKNFKFLFAPVFIALLFISCNKKGCSDPTADNYLKNVRKAKDKKCEYNGEGICGVGVSFCMEINGSKRTGSVYVSQVNSSTTQLFWASGTNQNAIGYEDLTIEFPKGSQTKLQIGSSGNSNKFQALYYSMTGGFINPSSGSMLIKKNNSNDGIIATFSLTLENGTQIKEGNIYKAK
ncbi:MAG: hypothetical protein ACSHXL_04980 [Bacteroidota bacterium]